MTKMDLGYDFEVPEDCRGCSVILENITLNIPKKAKYILVNPLEEEEEFLGFQGLSDRQEIRYYDSDRELIGAQDLEKQIRTDELMHKMESKFKALY